MKVRRLFETYSLWAFLVALILVLAVKTDFQFVRPENAAKKLRILGEAASISATIALR